MIGPSAPNRDQTELWTVRKHVGTEASRRADVNDGVRLCDPCDELPGIYRQRRIDPMCVVAQLRDCVALRQYRRRVIRNDEERHVCSPSLSRRIQHVARESSLDIRYVIVDFAEPVSGAWRDDDDVSWLDVIRLPAFDPRGAVVRVRHRPARRVRAAAVQDVVDLRYVLAVTILGVHARVVWPIDSAADDERFHNLRPLTGNDAERRLIVVKDLSPLSSGDEITRRRHDRLRHDHEIVYG